jgi:hypothetical protein
MNQFRALKTLMVATGLAVLSLTLLSARAPAGDFMTWQRSAPARSSASSVQTYEIRTYRIYPGKMDAFVTFMGEKLVPYWERHGMRILGHFVAEKENTYVWILTYPDAATQARMSAEVHSTAEWQESIAPLVRQYIEKSEVVLATPTAYSKAQ